MGAFQYCEKCDAPLPAPPNTEALSYYRLCRHCGSTTYNAGFKTVEEAVVEILDRLDAIEEKLNER